MIESLTATQERLICVDGEQKQHQNSTREFRDKRLYRTNSFIFSAVPVQMEFESQRLQGRRGGSINQLL